MKVVEISDGTWAVVNDQYDTICHCFDHEMAQLVARQMTPITTIPPFPPAEAAADNE